MIQDSNKVTVLLQTDNESKSSIKHSINEYSTYKVFKTSRNEGKIMYVKVRGVREKSNNRRSCWKGRVDLADRIS